jgi:hypothetical protein
LETLAWLEQTVFSLWVRESLNGFLIAITFHSLGMGLLVGVNIAIDLRVLGIAEKVPLVLLKKFIPVMWAGFIICLVSGIMLLIAYPAKALTNSVFYLKFLFVILAFIITRMLCEEVLQASSVERQPVEQKYKIIAAASLIFWVAAILAGRFLAYTNSVLLVSELY